VLPVNLTDKKFNIAEDFDLPLCLTLFNVTREGNDI